MSTFRTYLWKEWREQRAAVIALAIVLPALVLSISAALPRRFLGDATFPATVVGIALVAALVAIVGEFLVADARSGGAWLERLPGGLRAAFPAKLVALGLTTAVAIGFGLALGLGASLLEGHDVLARAWTSVREERALGAAAAAGLALAAWTFAASAWCPRGMLALCAGALLAAGLGAPLWLHRMEGYAPRPWEALGATLLLVLAGLASGYVGFTRGRRLGGTRWTAAWRGTGAGLLCLLPLHAWAAHAVLDRERIALEEGSPGQAWIFGDGRMAVISLAGGHPGWPSDFRILLLDLEQQTWRRIGLPDAAYDVLADPRDPATPRVVAIFHDDYHETTVLDALDATPIAMDASELDSLVQWQRADPDEILCFDADGELWSRDEDGLHRYDLTTGAVTPLFSFADAREVEALEP